MRDPQVGEVLVLSVFEREGAVSAHRPFSVERWQPSDLLAVPEVVSSFDLARRLARRYCPAYGDDGRVRSSAMPRLRRIGPAQGPGRLEGLSAGLPFYLAWVSDWLELPVPVHIAATGVLGPDGQVCDVSGDTLAAKLSAVCAFAPQVTTVLVPRAQAEAARTIAERDALSLTVVGVRHVTEAQNEVFKGFEKALQERWRADAVRAERTATLLYRIALDSARTAISLPALERTAQLLEPTLADEVARQKLVFAKGVVRRLDNEAEVLALPNFAGVRRPIVLRLTHHALMSVADAAEPGWEAMARRAAGLVAEEGMETEEDLQVLGALGRLYATWGRAAEARTYLSRAVEGWHALEQGHLSAPALADWLRLEAQHGVLEGLEAIDHQSIAVLKDPLLHAVERGRLVLGRVRAWTLCGDRRAWEALSHWSLTTETDRFLTARWRALAMGAALVAGEHSKAEDLRGWLTDELADDPRLRDLLYFAQIEWCVLGGAQEPDGCALSRDPMRDLQSVDGLAERRVARALAVGAVAGERDPVRAVWRYWIW